MIIPQVVLEKLKQNPSIGRERLAEETGVSESDARMYCREYKGRVHHRKDMKYKKGIALYDIHYPEQDEPSVNIVYDFMKDLPPKAEETP